jgi:hypothetical protein
MWLNEYHAYLVLGGLYDTESRPIVERLGENLSRYTKAQLNVTLDQLRSKNREAFTPKTLSVPLPVAASRSKARCLGDIA